MHVRLRSPTAVLRRTLDTMEDLSLDAVEQVVATSAPLLRA